jgi:hypothetical protein
MSYKIECPLADYIKNKNILSLKPWTPQKKRKQNGGKKE